MPAIHIFGSSHVSPHHLLPSVFMEAFAEMEDSFQKKFYPGTIKGISGGKISSDKVNNFVTVAANTSKESGYDGQRLSVFSSGPTTGPPRKSLNPSSPAITRN